MCPGDSGQPTFSWLPSFSTLPYVAILQLARALHLLKNIIILIKFHVIVQFYFSFNLNNTELDIFIFQAFSQMRLSEASAHLGSFSLRIKEEPTYLHANVGREGQIGTSWISSTASKAADAVLSTCPSPYEKRCLLQLLAATDFGDGGYASAFYRKCYWKTNLAEPLLCKDDELQLGNETLDDVSLLYALEKNRRWEQARNWARQLEASGGQLKSAMNHVTESQVKLSACF